MTCPQLTLQTNHTLYLLLGTRAFLILRLLIDPTMTFKTFIYTQIYFLLPHCPHYHSSVMSIIVWIPEMKSFPYCLPRDLPSFWKSSFTLFPILPNPQDKCFLRFSCSFRGTLNAFVFIRFFSCNANQLTIFQITHRKFSFQKITCRKHKPFLFPNN